MKILVCNFICLKQGFWPHCALTPSETAEAPRDTRSQCSGPSTSRGFEIGSITSPEPPITKGSDRLHDDLRSLGPCINGYQRKQLKAIISTAQNTKEPSFITSPSSSVAFIPPHHLATALQGASHQRHLLLEGRPEDENTPQSRGTRGQLLHTQNGRTRSISSLRPILNIRDTQQTCAKFIY